MKILQVIHGFPPYYMAGSEVYTYNLTKELSKNHEVYVFTRIENPFLPAYEYIDEVYKGLKIRRINKPQRDYSLEDKYKDSNIDHLYRQYVKKINPDIVHIQHLSHLSTNIINITKDELDIPIVFTIHDFWMYCVRGQLIQSNNTICNGPEIKKCSNCLYYLHTNPEEVRKYREHMENIIRKIDIFLAPSKFIKQFYEKMNVPSERIVYSRYGFRKDLIKFRKRIFHSNDKISFGFVGRIIPTKGIHILIKSFASIKNKNDAKLLIYGDAGKAYQFLKDLADENTYFKGKFDNDDIDHVLDAIDILIVPSIWYENSPLVIQEAFLKGIPVITSNIGGMAELVKDGVNGFLFDVGSIEKLKEKIEMIIKNPTVLNSLTIDPNSVRSIREDSEYILKIYEGLIKSETTI